LISDREVHAAFLENRRIVAAVSDDWALEEAGGWQLQDSGTGLGGLNQAMALAGQEAVRLETVERWYAARAQPYSLVLRYVADAELLAAATAAGFERERSQPVMVRTLPCEVVPVAGLELRQVRTVEDALAFLEVRRDTSKVRPPDDSESAFMVRLSRSGRFSYFIAEFNGAPVGTVMSSFMGTTAIVANLFVAQAWRRRGFGADITSRAASSWPEATSVALEASSEGALLYGAMGFDRRFNYVRMMPPEAG
jgi:hypothetical protein